MENVVEQYSMFHRALVRFETEFFQKIKPSVPGPLTSVRRMHEIMLPNDEDFEMHRVDRVIRKVVFIIGLTEWVVTRMGPYVRPSELWWVRAKNRSIGLYTSMVRYSLVALRLEPEDDMGRCMK
ncbi:hypothetical protein PoB_007680100 [Plakobranchus ocellatus]|uniref:Uncharacterized protein n=1 Tax=Plakobranchus ocellatus TaxID=259542 RepID=A0AAV4E2J1_9GAST|nr:hypothetical protein PoB_007680100 [Plakobranchus ocellatus]